MADVLYDTFTDTDGTALSAHTPDTSPVGSAWADRAGTWAIYSGVANITVAANSAHATIDCGVADNFVISTYCAHNTGSALAGRYVGVLFRWTDTTHWIGVGFNEYNDDFAILIANGGNPSIVANTSVSIAPTEFHEVLVTVSGTSIVATIDGANEISTTSSLNLTAEEAGLLGRDVETYFNWVLLTAETGPLVNVSEDTTVGEAITISIEGIVSNRNVSVTEDTTVGESVSSLLSTSVVSVSEDTTVADTLSYYSEDIIVGEEIIVYLANYSNIIAVAEDTTVGEDVTVTLPGALIVSSSESTTVGEAIQFESVISLTVSTFDNTVVSESYLLSGNAMIVSASDDTAVSDAISSYVSSMVIAVSEDTTVSETTEEFVHNLYIDATEDTPIGETTLITVSSQGDVLINVLDSTVVGDDPTMSVSTLTISVSEGVTGSESNSLAASLFGVDCNEITTVGDVATVTIEAPLPFTLSVSDGVTTSDSVVTAGGIYPISSDDAAVGETVSVLINEAFDLYVSVSDGITVLDSVNLSTGAMVIYVADGTTVGETTVFSYGLFVGTLFKGMWRAIRRQ